MLKLINITKDYPFGGGKVEALKGISLEFRKSEFVAILGPSGCGKTTLLNIIGGLDRYTSGDLIIRGKSTKLFRDHDWDSYRNHSIGFVFQTYNLIPHQNVLGNVELALTLSGISRAERKARAIAALESVGLGDQIYKKPNQLSGGQMQRVAIARALVNNPDIILADEPTGAIDSETSLQIMEILKEISKDRLVIMVTHNPELATRYATRIINLLDGLVTSDSKPLRPEELEEVKKEEKKKKARKERTSMSFITAFGLSLKNLLTKKMRTLITAFAGSIGIIGIALVASVANGFQNYIDKMQSDTLSGFPLEIARKATDYEALLEMRPSRSDAEEYPDEEKVYVNKIKDVFDKISISNDITDEYINNVIEKIDPTLYNSIVYEYGTALNVFKEYNINGQDYYLKVPLMNWSPIPKAHSDEEYSFFESQYDVIGGRLPEGKEELVLVVNKYNQISDFVFESLGIAAEDRESFDFDELIGTKYKLLLNDAIYSYNDEAGRFASKIIKIQNIEFVSEETYNTKGPDAIELEIVGIVRANEITEIGALDGAIGYTVDLIDYVLERNENSEIVSWMHENELLDPLTGGEYIDTTDKTAEDQREEDRARYGALKKPVIIKIFPVDFAAKEKIKAYLDEYNENKKAEAIAEYYRELGITEAEATEEQKETAKRIGHAAGVYYTDLMGVMESSLNTLIDAISIVLIVFTSISLVVSSIMIGIITYISVLERTKEIGILRSIGARKKDIARVFNAEAIIIGLLAGTIGITITLISLIPINQLLKRLSSIPNLAILAPQTAIALIIISIFLTFIAGLIPSGLAAKRDPVIALRTE
ncbi:MAG: ABC transporter ATP-binding protein/permease [Acholeplasmataceae bacterium]|jgi:putative ABC transport system permease protein|nr:ABC transporter ATP-binding protein/permease [Acholeplasmataceae bacterium]